MWAILKSNFCFLQVSAKAGCHLPNEFTKTSTLKAFSYIKCVQPNACSNCSDCQIHCSASSHHRLYGCSCCITDITHCFQSDMWLQWLAKQYKNKIYISRCGYKNQLQESFDWRSLLIGMLISVDKWKMWSKGTQPQFPSLTDMSFIGLCVTDRVLSGCQNKQFEGSRSFSWFFNKL